MKIKKKNIKVSLLVIATVSLLAYFTQIWITIFRCNVTAEDAKINDLSRLSVDKKDAWGTPLTLERVAEKMYVGYSVRSMGRDKIHNTDDDIVRSVIDWNKSRIVGEWVGEKSTEAFKGFKDGIKIKSKFKEDTD
jgi:hypothetical protein